MFTNILGYIVRFLLGGYTKKIENGEQVPIAIDLICCLTLPFYAITNALDLVIFCFKFVYDFIICIPQVFLKRRKYDIIKKQTFSRKFFIYVLTIIYGVIASISDESKDAIEKVIAEAFNKNGVDTKLVNQIEQLNSYTLTLFK